VEVTMEIAAQPTGGLNHEVHFRPTHPDLIHTETGVSAVALSPDDLAMLARYVVGVIAQNDRQRAERKARRCGLINFRVQEYASRVFAARLNAETRKQNEPCLK
jgi:hypothetical protein